MIKEIKFKVMKIVSNDIYNKFVENLAKEFYSNKINIVHLLKEYKGNLTDIFLKDMLVYITDYAYNDFINDNRIEPMNFFSSKPANYVKPLLDKLILNNRYDIINKILVDEKTPKDFYKNVAINIFPDQDYKNFSSKIINIDNQDLINKIIESDKSSKEKILNGYMIYLLSVLKFQKYNNHFIDLDDNKNNLSKTEIKTIIKKEIEKILDIAFKDNFVTKDDVLNLIKTKDKELMEYSSILNILDYFNFNKFEQYNIIKELDNNYLISLFTEENNIESMATTTYLMTIGDVSINIKDFNPEEVETLKSSILFIKNSCGLEFYNEEDAKKAFQLINLLNSKLNIDLTIAKCLKNETNIIFKRNLKEFNENDFYEIYNKENEPKNDLDIVDKVKLMFENSELEIEGLK